MCVFGGGGGRKGPGLGLGKGWGLVQDMVTSPVSYRHNFLAYQCL